MFKSLVRPAALTFRPKMPSDWTYAVGREGMTKTARPTPPSGATTLRSVGSGCKACATCNSYNKRDI